MFEKIVTRAVSQSQRVQRQHPVKLKTQHKTEQNETIRGGNKLDLHGEKCSNFQKFTVAFNLLIWIFIQNFTVILDFSPNHLITLKWSRVSLSAVTVCTGSSEHLARLLLVKLSHIGNGNLFRNMCHRNQQLTPLTAVQRDAMTLKIKQIKF